ncbi:prepilin peptidase [Leptolyngbya sp. 'hensonii']|uniref:prepilin peptidase n=1 Tax=Leptolyngbya sp. 'hensonii' TaxID=1922337 RepID=UPI00094FF70C|nr:A24 family peptidase [Leptolyngbya sp. 'hensonii']OLP16463.1 prepilin peptidase [Leptolyngbya sp. 'hensonii']
METLFLLIIGLFVFALGSAIGSFLNVVIYRIPSGLSLLWPPSRCPVCLHRLGRSENVPVLGWLWLKGRCKNCRTRISVRYPCIEAATGCLFVLVYWQTALSQEALLPLKTLVIWVFASWLLALAMIDLDTMTLPHVLTKWGLLVGLLSQAIAGLAAGGWAGCITHLMTGIGGAVVGIWLLDIVTIVGSIAFAKPAMGGGDAKLAAMMGAWLGWKLFLLAGFLACAGGAFLGGGAIALGWLNRGQPFPFGPFLALGAFIAALWGEQLVAVYLRVFFPTL